MAILFAHDHETTEYPIVTPTAKKPIDLKTRDGKSFADLQRIYVPHLNEEILVWETKDLTPDGFCLRHKDGRDLKFLSAILFMSEVFASELEAVRYLVERHDAVLADKREEVIGMCAAGEKLHRKLSRLEESNAPYLPNSATKPTERVGSCRI